MPNKNEVPEPGSQVENPAIFGKHENQTMDQWQAEVNADSAATAAATPAPPGFESYRVWADLIAMQMKVIKEQNDKIILMLENR